MAIIQTVLNSTRANATNFSNFRVPLTSGVEVLLLQWGHLVPQGTQFIEVNSCIGWENSDGAEAVEFRLYQNGTLVAIANNNIDALGISVDAVTNFKSILTSFDPNTHNVFQLKAIAILFEGTTATVKGPLNASAVSYGFA
jgi:hypothetical protein